jgi:putative endonuclease
MLRDVPSRAHFLGMHWCYILHSSTIDKFYIGETEDLELRTIQHNSAFFKNSYTSRASDWIIYISLRRRDRSHARQVELFIKKMKSKKFIVNLRDSVELQTDIINRF